MKEKKITGVVEYAYFGTDICIEFGRTQAELSFSDKGGIQRALKLKEGDKVEVIIKKINK